ncbi:MAG: HAD family phosphatase [Pseudomonadota bacterium]
MTARQFSAIIFDCDGVLVDSEALGLDASVAFLKSRGFTWEAPDLIRIFTGYRDDIFRRKLEDAYRDIHGEMPDESLFEGLIETRRRNKHKLKAISGAENCIRTLRDQKPTIPIAVASSSRTPLLTSKLERTGLWDLLAPHVYSADLVAEGKPAPDVFLYAAQKLDVAPGTCLVIEDSVQGVKAGLAAGMTVWGFTGGSHCFEGHAERLTDAGAARIIENFGRFQKGIKGLTA